MSPSTSSTQSGEHLLLAIERPGEQVEKLFVEAGLSIGRAKSNTICIDHPDVDHIHARVVELEKGVYQLKGEEQAKLRVIEPLESEVGHTKIFTGLVLELGGVKLSCRKGAPKAVGADWATTCPVCTREVSTTTDKLVTCGECAIELAWLEADDLRVWIPQQLGDWHVQHYVARGGMGIVLQAVHEKDDRQAAIKLLKPEISRDERWRKRLAKEAEIAKTFTHPSLVRFEDAGHTGELHWVAFEWVEGKTLSENLRLIKTEGNKLSLYEVAYFLLPVVQALMPLHNNGMVHRDLKPGNILLDYDGHVKLADFGLAKDTNPEEASTTFTQSGAVAGTYSYMAPEQLEGLELTPQADIYALGVIWHEMLVQKLPGRKLRIQEGRPDCPEAWCNLIQHCLADESKERPSLPELEKTIQSILAMDVGKEPDPSPVQLVKKSPFMPSQVPTTEDTHAKNRKKAWAYSIAAAFGLMTALFWWAPDKQQANKKSEPPPLPPGTLLWSFKTGGAVLSSPAIGADGTIYVGSDDKKIYAINGKTGEKKWEVLTGTMGYSSPAIGTDGTVYVGSNDKKIYALNGKNGTIKWEFSTTAAVHSSPAIGVDSTVYVATTYPNNQFYALDGKKGTQKWVFGSGPIQSSPAIGADGTVFIGTDYARPVFYALNGKKGTERWGFPIPDGFIIGYSSASIGAGGMVYIGSTGWKVYAVDGQTGTSRWEFKTGGRVYSSPSVGIDGTVYVGSDDYKVYALGGKWGVKKWEFSTGGWVRSSPAIGVDGIVYVGSNDWKVYALDGKSGVKKWEFSTGGGVYSSPVIGNDGTVYVGSNDNKVYAIATSSKGPAKSPWPMRGQNARRTGRTLK